MADLARMAGVDVSTVSRALSDSPRVKPETRQQILTLADEIGYEVNAAARNLRKRSTRTIGIVVPIDPALGQTISDPFYLKMVGAVTGAAAARDYDLLLTVPRSDGRVAEQRLLRAGKVDGLIVIGQAGRADRLNELASVTDKLVVWGGALGGARYTVVGSDNEGGGYTMTRHLLGLGRKRVLFVGDTALPEVALRYDGLRRAHDDIGVAHDTELVLPLGFGASTVAGRTAALIASGVRFDAVFGASDVLALGAMKAIQEAGLAVPGDVAVGGYDNVADAVHASPSLTTISQDIEEGGALMVDLLLRKLDGERVESVTTRTDLIVRASTEAVP